jgi:hypothetical protein
VVDVIYNIKYDPNPLIPQYAGGFVRNISERAKIIGLGF